MHMHRYTYMCHMHVCDCVSLYLYVCVCVSVNVAQSRVIEEDRASVEVIILTYGPVYWAFSCLMVDVKGIKPLWVVPSLGRWSQVVLIG